MKEKQRLGERISDKVAAFGGSWAFIFSFVVLLAIWLTVNTISFFHGIAFDHVPFISLNLVLSTIAALQAPFILMSQRRATMRQDEVYRELFNNLEKLILRQKPLPPEVDIKKLKREISEIKKIIEQSESEN